MYGLSGVGREQIGDSFQLNYGVSLGVFVLKSDASGFSRKERFEDISFCAEGEFSLDFFIIENFAIGLGAALQVAPFQELKDGRVFLNSFEFNRIDLFGGIRAYFCGTTILPSTMTDPPYSEVLSSTSVPLPWLF